MILAFLGTCRTHGMTEEKKMINPTILLGRGTESILVIDDNHEFRSIVCDFLMDAEYDVWDVACPKDAFSILHSEKIDVILCDMHLPFSVGEDISDYLYSAEVGLRTIQELSGVFPEKPVIAMSAMVPPESFKAKNQIGRIPMLVKPFHQTELLSLLDELLTIRGTTPMH